MGESLLLCVYDSFSAPGFVGLLLYRGQTIETGGEFKAGWRSYVNIVEHFVDINDFYPFFIQTTLQFVAGE